MKLPTKDAWFTAPWPDTLFLIGAPIIFGILLVGGMHAHRLLSSHFMAVSGKLIYNLVGLHLMATFAVIYLDANEWRNNLLVYVWIPLSLLGVFFALRFSGMRDLTASVLYYSIIVHEVFQYYFIVRIFQLTRKRFSAIDTLISGVALIPGPTYSFLYSIITLKIKYDYYGNVLPLPVGHAWLEVFKILTLIALPVFIARQVYLYVKKGEIYWFTILMVLTSNCIFFLPFLVFKSGGLFFYASFKVHHGIQYLAWIMLYCRLKYKGRIVKGARLLSYVTAPRRIILWLAFLFLLLVVNRRIYLAIAAAARFNLNEINYLTLAFLHVYLDMAFWWNTRKVRAAMA